MSKSRINNQVRNYRLHIAFLITLTLIILGFYFFPKFNYFFSLNKKAPVIPTLELIQIPVTIQNPVTVNPHEKPQIPVTIRENDLLDSVLISIKDKIQKNSVSQKDSMTIAFISDMFPDLVEIKDFNPGKIIEESKKKYDFKSYFAYQMSLANKNKIHEPSSPLVDEALNGAMGRPKGMLSINILQIPLSASGPLNIRKQHLTLTDLLNIKEHFGLLQYLYENPNISLQALYRIKPVSNSYTYENLSTAVNGLQRQGLIVIAKNQPERLYTAAFTIPEMIENLNRILAEISDKDNENREYLYGLVHLLITWS